MLKEFKYVFAVLGVLMSASALISLFQTALSFGLAPILEGFVDFYRDITQPVIGVLYAPIESLFHALGWNWKLPRWIGDLHLLSFVGAGIFSRSLEFDAAAYPKAASEAPMLRGIKMAFATFVMGLLFVGLWWFVWRAPHILLFASSRVESTPKSEDIERGVTMVLGLLPHLAANKTAENLTRAKLTLDAARIANRRRMLDRARVVLLASILAVAAFYATNFAIS